MRFYFDWVAHAPGADSAELSGWSAQDNRRNSHAVCAMQHTVACDDCVVTFICSRTADDAVVVDVDEWRAVKLLQDAGLVPKLRHRRRTG